MNRKTFPCLTLRDDLLAAGSQNSPSCEQGAALGGFCGIQEAGLVHQPPAPPCFQQFKAAAGPLDDEWRRGGASEW